MVAHEILVSAQGPLVLGFWVWGFGVWGLGLTIIFYVSSGKGWSPRILKVSDSKKTRKNYPPPKIKLSHPMVAYSILVSAPVPFGFRSYWDLVGVGPRGSWD